MSQYIMSHSRRTGRTCHRHRHAASIFIIIDMACRRRWWNWEQSDRKPVIDRYKPLQSRYSPLQARYSPLQAITARYKPVTSPLQPVTSPLKYVTSRYQPWYTHYKSVIVRYAPLQAFTSPLQPLEAHCTPRSVIMRFENMIFGRTTAMLSQPGTWIPCHYCTRPYHHCTHPSFVSSTAAGVTGL